MKNQSLLAPIVDPEVKLYTVQFFEPDTADVGGRHYTYKYRGTLEPGEIVLAEARSTYTAVKVVEQVEIPMNDESTTYKWIVQRLDPVLKALADTKEAEAQLIKTVNRRRVENSREAVLGALGLSLKDAETLSLAPPVEVEDAEVTKD